MRWLLGLTLLAAASFASAEDLTYNVFFNGIKAGSETVELTNAGGFTANGTLKVGTVVLSEKLDAQISGSTLVSSDAIATNPGGTLAVPYADGKMSVTSPQLNTTAAFTIKENLYGSNLIVPLWRTSVSEALKSLAASPSTHDATINSYFIDLGQVIPVRFRSLPSRRCFVGKVA